MRLPLPGPSDLLDAARDLAAAGAALGRAASGAIALVPRLEQAVDRVELLLDRAEAAVVRIEETAADADAAVASAPPLLAQASLLLDQLVPVLDQAQAAVTRTTGVLDGADAAVTRTTGVLDGADAAVVGTTTVLDRAGGLVTDASGLLGSAQGPLVELLPVLQRMAETLDPREVDAAVLLIDRLPELLRAVDDDLLPLARQLQSVGPEMHALLELVEDLHAMVSKLPGMGLVRRRKDPDDAD